MVPTHNSKRLRRTTSFHPLRQSLTTNSKQVPELKASYLECSTQMQHVQTVAEKLASKGILKISLDFADDDSKYLEQLVISLHKYHGHRLPISHSSNRGWFWDVRPSTVSTESAKHQARSETMEEFPWHTDCSYEDPTPKYFALHVLQPDRFGGGVLSLMSVQNLSERLDPIYRRALMLPEYTISTPPEFHKHDKQDHITGALFGIDPDGQAIMRFRDDLITRPKGFGSSAVADLLR